MASITRHGIQVWLSSIVLVCFASLLFDSASVHAATTTVTLKNGKTFEVKTKRGSPRPVKNRYIEMTFMGPSFASDTQQLNWTWSAQLKKKGKYTVTVTTPVDDAVSVSFEATGPGHISYHMFDSEKYPTLWSWIDDDEETWFPFVFSFEDTQSDKSFEIMQWGTYLGGEIRAAMARAADRIPETGLAQEIDQNETVAPPFDERDWQLGHKAIDEDDAAVWEYVLDDETVENWSELITVQSYAGLQDRSTPEDMMLALKQSILTNCPDGMWNIVEQADDEIVYEFRIEGCAHPTDSDDQYEIGKILKGSSALHVVSYTTKRQPHLPETERSEWINRIAGAEIAATDEVPPPSSTAKKRFLVEGGQVQSADDGPRPAPRIPTGAYLIEDDQIGVLDDFPRPYPTVPTRAFIVEGGAIGIQAGVRPDHNRPPLLPFGKKKYPTTYFVFLTNETNRPIWTEIQVSFPVRGKKTVDRSISELKRDPQEDHRNTRGFLLESYGVVTDKKIPIKFLIFSDEEHNNLIGMEETFMYFAKEEVGAFLKRFSDTPPLYGWPEIGVPDSAVPGTVADAGLQSAIQYTLWKEESKTYRDCEHNTLHAEPVDLDHSTIVAGLAEGTGESGASSSERKDVLVEHWSVRSCEVTSRYEVLLAETSDAGAVIIVRKIGNSIAEN